MTIGEIYRGVIKSVRQITTIDDKGIISSNLEATFKDVEKQNVDEDGNVTWEKVEYLPAYKKDGTAYNTKAISLSNRCISSIEYKKDNKLSTIGKKVFNKLFAQTPNPLNRYSNVGELFSYMLKDRGIMFRRDLISVGDKIIADNGGVFENTDGNKFQTVVLTVVGTLDPLDNECIEEWTPEEHKRPQQQPQQPQQPQPQPSQAMWANV